MTDGEFKASVVGAYERGERAMSVQRLVRLAEIYSLQPVELLPALPSSAGEVIDLDRVASLEGDVAERYVAAIHMLRSGSESSAIRATDRSVLASLLEVESQMVTGQH